MCLTLPAKIKAISGLQARLEDDRVVKIAGLQSVSVGDWVLVNADLAVAKISGQEAQEINNYFQ